MVAGVILAGGLSRRMGGGDKCLLPLGGKPMLAHVIARLRPQVDRLALNANGDPTRFATFGLEVVPDGIAGNPGPLAGVLAGLDWAAAAGEEAIVTVAADTPLFPETLVVRLVQAATLARTPLAMALSEDPERGYAPHPTFGLWPVALREDLRASIAGGARRVRDWTAPRGCAETLFPGAHRPFFNVNTPADLAEAEALVAGTSS